MTTILQSIKNALFKLTDAVLSALITVLNLLIKAVGVALEALVAVLPDMPGAPEVPGGNWISWLNWFLPLGQVLALATVWVTLLVGYLVLRVGLRWVKAQ